MERTPLDYQIQQLKSDILGLSRLVEEAVLGAMTALKDHDPDAARLIVLNDREINDTRFALESATIGVIARQQPAAGDLRRLTTILALCSELERIGDYAKGIASIQLRSGGLGLPKLLRDLHYMARKAVNMLERAMQAFIQEEQEAARQIIREDDLIDALYEQIYFETIDLIVDDPANIERCNYVLWVAHNLERVADRTTNICERAIYIVTGEWSELFVDEVEPFTAEVK